MLKPVKNHAQHAMRIGRDRFPGTICTVIPVECTPPELHKVRAREHVPHLATSVYISGECRDISGHPSPLEPHKASISHIAGILALTSRRNLLEVTHTHTRPLNDKWIDPIVVSVCSHQYLHGTTLV